MTKGKRIPTRPMAALALLMALGLGCASSKEQKSKPLFGTPMSNNSSDSNAIAAAAAADGANAARVAREAGPYAEGKCAGLLTQEYGPEEEQTIGATVWASRAPKEGALPPDARVSKVGMKLAKVSARPELPWRFAVFQSDAVDSFSAPGGTVGVTTGLLAKASTDAQLAGVLAHEIGHVVLKHPLLRYRDVKHHQCVAAHTAAYVIEHGGPKSPATDQTAAYARSFDGTAAQDAQGQKFSAFLMDAFLQMLKFGYDRDTEFQTDRTGFELLTLAGFDPAEYEKLLTSLGTKDDDRVAKLKVLRESRPKDTRKKR